MEVRALIIDDEPLAQDVIKQYANKLPELDGYLISSTVKEFHPMRALCSEMLDSSQTPPFPSFI